jgi:hypothetical protein
MDHGTLERLGDEIAELAAHLDAAAARLLELIRRFDVEGGWNNGFRSCAEWLSWRTGIDLGAARQKVRVARALTNLPRLAQALARGELSYAKVRALTRVATPDNEGRLLKVGLAGTAEQVERIVRGWRWMDRKAELRDAAAQHKHRALHVYRTDDGAVIIRGRLAPEVGALLMKALDAARGAIYQRGRISDATPAAGEASSAANMPSMEQQQADALALLAEAALHNGFDPGAPGERYQVVVHVDAPVLADADHPGQSALDEGVRVSAETSQRLACDASRVVMRHDAQGNLLEIGARTRTIPAALRRALQHRDRSCRFPGCHARFGQGHHIRQWAHGGPTTLSNLALLCPRHHRAVHEEGYRVERRTNGELRFRHPHGHAIPDIPSRVEVQDDPVEAIRSWNEADGLELDAHTATPLWHGERLDVAYALDVLHPLAEPLPTPVVAVHPYWTAPLT